MGGRADLKEALMGRKADCSVENCLQAFVLRSLLLG